MVARLLVFWQLFTRSLALSRRIEVESCLQRVAVQKFMA
jgi:hypothetical protein